MHLGESLDIERVPEFRRVFAPIFRIYACRRPIFGDDISVA